MGGARRAPAYSLRGPRPRALVPARPLTRIKAACGRWLHDAHLMAMGPTNRMVRETWCLRLLFSSEAFDANQ